MNQEPANIDIRFRTILTLWFAISMSVMFFLVVVRFSPVAPVNNPILSLLLNSLGVGPLAVSFLVKMTLLNKSVATQRPELVQSAYVLSFALCEMAALMGLVDHFLTGSSYYYLGFGLAGVGMLLHFPQKKHLQAASYKKF